MRNLISIKHTKPLAERARKIMHGLAFHMDNVVPVCYADAAFKRVNGNACAIARFELVEFIIFHYPFHLSSQAKTS